MAKVLVVDDVPDNVKLLALELEDDGYEVFTAGDGQLGLVMARAVCPDVILMDIMMPVMDGIEACRALKADAQTESIPVIMVSARGQEQDITRGLDAGAVDYITKPFNSQIVAARVRSAARIKAAQVELEERVRDRTAALAEANAALRREIEVRRRAEGELRASEERFRSLAEAMPQLAWVSRADGYTEYFNRRWFEYTGARHDDCLGDGWIGCIHAEDHVRTLDLWSLAVYSGDIYEVEYRIRAADGSYRWFLGRGTPLRDGAARVVKWFGTCTDIDAQKRAEEALRRSQVELEERVRDRTAALAGANAALRGEVAERRRAEQEALAARLAAEAATRAKSEFLANMSHEIRTPMNGILGMADLALEAEAGDPAREYLGMLKASAESLLTVIGDILDFSKIEAGKLDIEPVPFALRPWLDLALGLVRPRAAEKGLDMNWRVDPAVPEAVVGDPGRLRQVMLNLVGNAVKFTATGGVTVAAAVESLDDAGGQALLRFSVADTGIGIPPEKHAAIFRPFEQADGSTTRRFGGTGLGLTISSKLVGLMGGTLWIDGSAASGSTFHFTVRLGLGAARPGDAVAVVEDCAGPPCGPCRPLRVLLAEDNPVNQRVAARLLERLGHSAVVVGDGLEAVRAMQADVFDLVLMDVSMPEMGGFEAVALARSHDFGPGGRVPIVALTAHAMKGDRERCLAGGFDGYIPKPIRLGALAQAIAELLAPVPAGVG